MSDETEGDKEGSWAEARNGAQQVVLQAALEDLETRAAEQQQELFRAQASLEEQRKKVILCEEEKRKCQSALESRTSETSRLQTSLAAMTSTMHTLEDSKKETQERLDRMQAEGDMLREEIKRLTNANNDYQQRIVSIETQAKLGDSQVIPLRFQVDRLEKEMDTLTTHNAWLNGQLQEASDQLAQLRQLHASELTDLRASVAKAEDDKSSFSVDVTRLKSQVSSLEGKNQHLSSELRDVKANAAQERADAEEELQSSQRIINLQATQLEMLQGKHDSLATQLENMQQLALEADRKSSQAIQIRQQDLETHSKQILTEQAQNFENRISDLEEELSSANRRLKEAEDGILNTSTPRRVRLPQTMRSKEAADDEPINLTDLHIRLAETEDTLRIESLKRKKAEIALQRIQAEMEAAAPRLLRQRREYEDAMERESTHRSRLDAALDEASVAQEESRQLQMELARVRERNQDFEAETKELAQQVQTLLVSRSNAGAFGAPLTPGEEMPAVSPEIIKMQQTNQRLAGQVRKMTSQLQEYKQRLESESLGQELKSYRSEIETLREDRKRHEVIATSLAQQRDLYRALLAKNDVGEEVTAIDLVKKHSEKCKLLDEKVRELEQAVANGKAQLVAVDIDKKAASERLARYEQLNQELTEGIHKLQTQVSQAKADAARGAAEVSFYKSKIELLEESLERSKNDANHISFSRTELQRINADLQNALAKANANTSQYENKLMQAKKLLRLAETQKEQAKASEKRMLEENQQLLTDNSRQGSMIQSIQRIENSLSAKAKSEDESQKEQIATLTEKLAALENQSEKKLEDLRAKLSAQEAIGRDLQHQKNQIAAEGLETKKEAAQNKHDLQIASQKCALLESQLLAAKRKLGDSTDEDIEGDLRSRIENLRAELKSSTEEVSKLKDHAASLEKIAKNNEIALKEQTQTMIEVKEEHKKEVAALNIQFEAAANESTKGREMIVELTNDLSVQREDRMKEMNEFKKQIAHLNSTCENERRDREAAENRYAQLEAEVLVLRADLTHCQANYERELALHASARADIRVFKENQEAENRLRKLAEQQAAEAKAELEHQQTSLLEKKEAMEAAIEDSQKKVEATRSQNTLLHNQLEKINSQIEMIQSSKGNPGDITESEVLNEQSTISELREVIRFVRADKELVQSQLDASKRAVERERATAAVVMRNLEEARAEIIALQGNKSTDSENDALIEKFNLSTQQTKLLEESNAHLRKEVASLESNISRLKSELESYQVASEPLEKKISDMKNENAGLVSEKQSLLREIEDWKGRVQSLVSKFNQVDPAEHARLVKRAELLEAELKTHESQKQAAQEETKRIRGLASRASKELIQSKSLIEVHKKTIATLTTEKEALEKEQKGLSKKDLKDAMDKIKKLEDDKANEKIQLTGAQEMNDKLRERLRQFQKQISEMKVKENQTEKQLNDAARELEKVKRNSEVMIASPEKKRDSPTVESEPKPIIQAIETEVDGSSSAAIETFKPRYVDPLTQNTTKAGMPSIPEGGFKFGPSTDASTTESSNKRPAEAPAERSFENKKTKTPLSPLINKGTSAPTTVFQATELTKDVVQRRGSGETREISMKEKLQEKKRKLKEALEKKQRLEKEAVEIENERSKKTKTESPSSEELSINAPTKAAVVAEESKANVETSTNTEPNKEKGSSEEASDSVLNADRHALKSSVASSVFGTSSGFGTGKKGFGQSSLATQPNSFGTGFGVSNTLSVASGNSGFRNTPEAGTKEPASGFGLSTKNTNTLPQAQSGFGSGLSTSSMATGSSFLNMKPPGSSDAAPNFSFGSSTSITLPTPANPGVQSNPFSAFSSQNQGSTFSAKPLFSQVKSEKTSHVQMNEDGGNSEAAEKGEEVEEGETTD